MELYCFVPSCRSTFCCPCLYRASGGRALCVVSGHVIHLDSFSAAVFVFGEHDGNQNERETLSGVPNRLRPFREPGVGKNSGTTSATAAGLPKGPAPDQEAQGAMHNAGQDGSHFVYEDAQEGRGR